jgi:hypothetical protein
MPTLSYDYFNILIDYEHEFPTKFQRIQNSKIYIIDILISLFYYFIIIFCTNFGLYSMRVPSGVGKRRGGTIVVIPGHTPS